MATQYDEPSYQSQLFKLTEKYDKLYNAASKLFTADQIDKLLGRSIVEWSDLSIQKSMAISAHVSNTGYEFLIKQGYPLPCLRTIQLKKADMNIRPGIMTSVLDVMEQQYAAANASEDERHAVIMVDETAIKPVINIAKDGYVTGYVSKDMYTDVQFNAMTEKDKHATHMYVFMVKFLSSNVKQPVAFYLTNNTVNADKIKKVLFRLIDELERRKISIHGLVSDMATKNKAMWVLLGVPCTRASNNQSAIHPFDDKRRFFIFPDTCHLIKNLRGQLQTSDLILSEEIRIKYGLSSNLVSYAVLKNVIKAQESSAFKFIPELNRKKTEPQGQQKMRVGPAITIFSEN